MSFLPRPPAAGSESEHALTARRPPPRLAALLAAMFMVALTTPMIGRGAAASGDEFAAALRAAQPLALAAADFDEDGVADLVSGYGTDSAGLLTLHRGNPDAIYPNTPAARARRRSGRMATQPFLPEPRILALPGPPDLLFTGDFDADGHFDVLVAAPGVGAAVLRGDGTGALGRPQLVPLPGTLTTAAVGDVDGPDGLADVALAVTARSGSRVLVFRGDHGAWTAQAAVYDVPAPVSALAFARLDGRHAADLAVGTGGELLIVHGRDRGAEAGRPPAVERYPLGSAITSLAAGDFTGDRQPDLAVAAADGVVRVFSATGAGRERAAAATAPPPAPEPTLHRTPVALANAGGQLVRARVTNRRADELFALDRRGGQLQLLMTDGAAPPAAVAGAGAILPMRLDADARDELVVLRSGDGRPGVLHNPAAMAHIVTNTDDGGPGSLRQAILEANAEAGDDLITFAIPGPGPHTITPTTPLPPVFGGPPGERASSVTIDATTEPDFAGTPIVELSGAIVGESGDGLTVASPGTVVRGLVINRFASGILFTMTIDGSAGTEGGIVEGNYIGTDVSGTTALGNGIGVMLGVGPIADTVYGIRIGGTAAAARNVISGNGIGLAVHGGLMQIQGNVIGTDATGSFALGNTVAGLRLFSSHLTEIGGTAPGSRNVISANGGDGLEIHETGPMLVRDNYIGTDISGARPLGNRGNGLHVPDSAVTVAGNVISANGATGIFASSVQAQVDVLDNRIGTNSAGTAALGNQSSGADVNGVFYAVRGNLVSGNGGHGLRLWGVGNVIQQNRVGTDLSGTQPLGNQGDGLHVLDQENLIGGDGEGNVIAFNSGRGIGIAYQHPGLNTILSNSIHSNGGLGIDIGNNGMDPIDACDADAHANAPVLARVSGSPRTLIVAGELNSRPGASFLLQVFASPAADPSGFGEGEMLIGTAMVTTDARCIGRFSATFQHALAAGQLVTATATHPPDQYGRRATSEFSNALPYVPETPAQAIRALIGQVAALVETGEVSGASGIVLYLKLRAALFLADHDGPRLAARQLAGFVHLVDLLVRFRLLDADDGGGLTETARRIITGLEMERSEK